jgi:hypothetical protein
MGVQEYFRKIPLLPLTLKDFGRSLAGCALTGRKSGGKCKVSPKFL